MLPISALAQVTTGNITGRVADASGGVIPGAKVVIISEVHGNRSAPVQTNGSGDYVFADVTPDRYTIEVTAPSFKTTRVAGILVTGGDRVGVPLITLQVGGTTETVSVTAEATLLQTESGERSYAIEQTQVENLPIGHSNFANVVAFTPGMDGTSRLGAPTAENNIMMNGVSAMDTGNNGQMLNINIESIGEVKVLTQGYQAEFGRSAGAQITAVTKSGSNAFHGSGYGIWTNSNWNSRSWTAQKNGTPQAYSYTDTYGFSVGGPIIIPKVFNGKNKLFFFFADEFRPSTTNVNVGAYLRVPTALERAGDYSQTLNNQGVLIAPIVDASTGKPFPNSVIPASRIYAPGLAVLNQYPLPNMTQAPGTAFNYAETPGSYNQLLSQPVARIDYNVTSKFRVGATLSEQRQRAVIMPGSIPGFNDQYSPYPIIDNYTVTADWTVTPSSVIEVTYGSIENQLAGGGSPGALLADPAANKNTNLAAFPTLYPNWGVLNTGYYAYKVLQAQGSKAPEYDASNHQLNMVPTFGWGSLIGVNGTYVPPNLTFPSYLNINHTHDLTGSFTKIWGRHTIKAGLYWNHSYKAQNTGAGGLPNLNPQGYIDFGNNTNNTLDSGFGFSNALLGVFNQDLQQSKYIEASMLYDNVEAYLQDTWKVTNRLTLDYGMRFVHQTPQYDEFGQESNFFPTQWTASNSEVLYTAGCSNGAVTCSGNVRNALNPITGAIVSGGSSANSQVLIGTPVPGVGNALNGIKVAGQGIANTNYLQPGLVVGPRIGAAYDVTGKSNWVIRGGIGLFYERPDGNTVFSTPGNAPIATDQNLYQSTLTSLGSGLSPLPVPSLVTMQYNLPIPSTWEWQAGIQKSLPAGMVVDFSYVGDHAYNQFGGTQGGTQQAINQVPLGQAYLPQYQDPTLGASTVPGASAYTTNLLRPFAGLGTIGQNTAAFQNSYHSLQLSVNRRFSHGFLIGANYTYGISATGNTGLVQRYTETAPGVLVLRSDEAAYEALNNTLDRRPHYLKMNTTWAVPGIRTMGSFVHQLTGDWQLSGVLTATSGTAYNLSYTYQTNGSNVNITGSPDFAGNVVMASGIGSGCSTNQFGQFSEASVTGPTYNSVQMESGRNQLRGCPTDNVDTAVVRNFHFWKFKESRTFQFRADIFNALNAVMISGRQTQAQFNNPTSMSLVNAEYGSTGNINSGRSLPQNAGLGAATAAQNMRNIQLELRLSF
ncbi:MAG TPA: TonB-dependent receptor [Bryobacteraceae bacterium]|nr:TonB-dependent receptor [Bryobacteraceae bacterium]